MSLLSFSEYMSSALYDPAMGYYNTDKLGRDFFTTPMKTDALACALWQHIVQYCAQWKTCTYIEIGPGRLQLARALVSFLERSLTIERIILVEKSAALRTWQQQHVKELWPPAWHHKIVWKETLDEMITDGICVGHEVLDAWPVDLVQYHQGSWYTMMVHAQNPDVFIRGEKCARPDTPWYDDDYEEHSVYEIYPFLREWLISLAQKLPQGLMLWIDYGDDSYHIYHPSRPQGTLRAYSNHKIVPWHYPGADITADVNWSYIASSLQPYSRSMALMYQAHLIASYMHTIYAEDIQMEGHRYLFDPTQMARRISIMTAVLQQSF